MPFEWDFSFSQTQARSGSHLINQIAYDIVIAFLQLGFIVSGPPKYSGEIHYSGIWLAGQM